MMSTCERIDRALENSSLLFWSLWILSLGLVALAQPAWIPALGPVASLFGYAMLFRLVAASRRPVLCAFFWFLGVQGFQWSWFANEVYQGKYIYGAYLLLIGSWALQFAILIWVWRRLNAKNMLYVAGLAGLWTLMEWGRLYVFTGSTFNHVGMALACHPYSLQAAAIFGMYGLCFWVMWVNLLAVRAWERRLSPASVLTCLGMAVLPYAWGAWHIEHHGARMLAQDQKLRAVLVQTAQPPIEALDPTVQADLFHYALGRWHAILSDLAAYKGERVDLIVMPESTVPYGTDFPAYFHKHVRILVEELFGKEAVGALPPLDGPYAQQLPYGEERLWVVSNAYIMEFLARFFEAEVVAGLQHKEGQVGEPARFYNSALYVPPRGPVGRYDKKLLLPIAEYIPFGFLKPLAAQYGIYDSFTRGDNLSLFGQNVPPFGVSICYEETFGDFTRQWRERGAELLVNLTNDVWYPHSALPRQHCEHGRLRTVENGIPLLRACNTGVTAAIDSLGRTVAEFGDAQGPHEWCQGSLMVDLPLYHYRTWYSLWGDLPILITSVLLVLSAGVLRFFAQFPCKNDEG